MGFGIFIYPSMSLDSWLGRVSLKILNERKQASATEGNGPSWIGAWTLKLQLKRMGLRLLGVSENEACSDCSKLREEQSDGPSQEQGET